MRVIRCSAGIALLLYKLPPTVDSTATFAELTAAFTPETVPRHGGSARYAAAPAALRRSSPARRLARVALTPADSGVLRMGVALTAPAADWRSDTHAAGGHRWPDLPDVRACGRDGHGAAAADHHARPQLQHATSLQVPFPGPTPTTLVVGGAPSARALMRFPWPIGPQGHGRDHPRDARTGPGGADRGARERQFDPGGAGVLVDLGAKSPLIPDVDGHHCLLGAHQRCRMSIEVLRIVKLWQGAGWPARRRCSRCSRPEASSFSVPVFGSTANPTYQPRLRIEYVRPYQFALP